MFPLALTASENAHFETALRASTRRLRFQAKLYSKTGAALATPLELLDGEVVVDATDPDTTPTRTAHITLLDKHRALSVNGSGSLWYSNQIGLTWGIYVSAMARYVDVPVFRGGIFEFTRRGAELEIDLQGKEAGHLGNATFPRGYSINRHTKIDVAIRTLLSARGETMFSLDPVTRRLARTKSWGIGQSPWRAVQRFADVVDKQLFYRGDGTLRMRPWPEQPSWVFNVGQDSILLDDIEQRDSIEDIFNLYVVRGERTYKKEVAKITTLAERSSIGDTTIKVADNDGFVAGRRVSIGTNTPDVRTINSVAGNVITLGRALEFNHPAGKEVTVRFRIDATKRVVGRAAYTQGHPLSAEALTDGLRPLVKVIDRPKIHKQPTAQQTAEQIRNRRLAVDQEVALSCLTVPHLEEGDKTVANDGVVSKTFRLKRFTIPLNLEGAQQINWSGRKVPRRRRPRKLGT